MLEAIVQRLHVPEHHRGAGIQSQPMCLAHYPKPLVALAFERCNSIAHAIDENLPTAAGNAAEAGFLELLQHLAHRHSKYFAEVAELRRREAVDIDVWILLADVTEHRDGTNRGPASDGVRLEAESEYLRSR
jgi:hypothetical protein